MPFLTIIKIHIKLQIKISPRFVLTKRGDIKLYFSIVLLFVYTFLVALKGLSQTLLLQVSNLQDTTSRPLPLLDLLNIYY